MLPKLTLVSEEPKGRGYHRGSTLAVNVRASVLTSTNETVPVCDLGPTSAGYSPRFAAGGFFWKHIYRRKLSVELPYLESTRQRPSSSTDAEPAPSRAFRVKFKFAAA
jgi:hypothetical protein